MNSTVNKKGNHLTKREIGKYIIGLRKRAAVCMAALMLSFCVLPAMADTVTEINTSAPQSGDTGATPEVNLSTPTTQQSSAPAAPQVSAAVQAATQAVQEGTAAVKNAQNEKNKMETGLQKAQDIKEELVRDRNEISSKVMELDGQMQAINDNLRDVQLLIDQKEAELEETSAKLIQARQDADEQYESMKVRIKFMYEKGTVDFIQILLGASSFSEMLNKAEYIEQLSAYDRTQLVRYEQTKEEMAELEEVLGVQQEVLQQTKDEVTARQKELSGLMEEKAAELSKYNQDIANKEAAIEEYEAMIAEQDETISELEKAAEAAKKKQQEVLAAESRASVSGNHVISYGGGQFCWPAPSYTRISDDYGTRIHPILGVEKFHNGVDMAAPSGSPILAAADGYVVAAAYSSTMGNYIMIDHGSGIYTIYMHASALYVSADQKVSKGDTIGAVGSTGRSTGAHLHFSVRVNGSYVSPWSYL
ncbi:MAG: peptidoglycan DD-metalloendopeptidase family protein [Lachnospiraceae bacterium]|nr:peptidoglycan DD-metalloendopeptidase family protein [Lachnospiraceae bacterium]